MKKITLLITLMITSLGFSQSLPINFSNILDNNFVSNGSTFSADFSPTDPTNPVGKIVGGTGQYNSLISLDLGTYIDMTTSSKTFTFQWYNTEAIAMTGLFQINKEASGGMSIEHQFTTTPTIGWQTITIDFSTATNSYPNAGLPVVFGQYAGISIFTNFGLTPGYSSTYYIDDIAGAANGIVVPGQAAPLVAAPIPPARNAADVLSIFSDAYTNIPITTWQTSWCDSTFSDITISGNNVKKINFTNFLGVQLANFENASAFTNFHMDYWLPSVGIGAVLNPKLSNHTGGGGETNALIYTNPVSITGQWVSIDVPLSSLTPQPNSNLDALNQFLISSGGGSAGPSIAYIDNIYLYKGTALGTANFQTSNVKLYPNPVTNTLNIEANSAIQKVTVYNLIGQEVITVSPKTNATTLQTSSLQKGVYMVTTEIDGKISTSKVVKE